jgi:hypothetical protein
MKITTATLKLFNAVRVNEYMEGESSLLAKTVPYGFILSRDVENILTEELLEDIKSYYLSTSKANQAFHKSWQTIKDTPQEELWTQAILHYFTTYGYEGLGIEGEVYIPKEKLDIPTDINLIKVVGLTDEDLITRIIEVGSGIALAKDTLEAIIQVIEDYNYQIDVDKIKNRELKSALYDLYDIVPQEPVEYLRFVLSRLTGKTLLIKSSKFISEIKECNSQIQRRELGRLVGKAPTNLAEIFFRYKPIFLALKSVSSNKSFFNRLRKDADLMHKPLPEDYLNNITSKIKHNKSLDELEDRLKNASIFRKIRLANALKFRLTNPQSIVYKVRNGRSWVDDFIAKNPEETKRALDIVLDSIKINKTVYVPEYIDYAIPATEKQFIGNIPANTKISVKDNLMVGVYWENVKNHRIDLDFSSIDLTGKVGWDSVYKSDDKNILYSGDMTDATKGASELLYFGQDNKKVCALFLNYYNFDKDIPVPIKIFVASEKPENFGRNYVANNIIIQSDFIVEQKQCFIGLVYGNSLYLSASSIGKSNVSGGGLADKTREYLLNSTTSALKLSEVINITREKGDYPDLSPEKLDKNSIIKLVTN